MDVYEESLELHRINNGKLSVVSKVPCSGQKDLSLAYTPGVAAPSRAIVENSNTAYDYTNRGNYVAVLSDGSAVLGIGNIGGLASLPVMEGKAILFKTFAGIDAFPICLATQDIDEVVNTCTNIAPTFGGINLEDISAPRCFDIEKRLKEKLDIPVFHDDQHGTAVVITAAILNVARLTGKKNSDIKVTISGAGAAGIASTNMLKNLGLDDIIVCDRTGIIYSGREVGMNPYKDEIALITNRDNLRGALADAIDGSDIFIGVSTRDIVNRKMVESMANDSVVMAMANPDPEISPAEADAGGARVVCTGRSDYPNQINNVLAFPGIFRGALDVRASEINEEMKMAAAKAIMSVITNDELSDDYIIPEPFDSRVVQFVAKAVSKAAIETNVAQI